MRVPIDNRSAEQGTPTATCSGAKCCGCTQPTSSREAHAYGVVAACVAGDFDAARRGEMRGVPLRMHSCAFYYTAYGAATFGYGARRSGSRAHGGPKPREAALGTSVDSLLSLGHTAEGGHGAAAQGGGLARE